MTQTHHGGAWKVAYADFVTAMMALFIVLWLLSQTDQETREQLSEYFRTGTVALTPSLMQGGTGVSEKGFIDVGGRAIQQEQHVLEASAKRVREALADAAVEFPELAKLSAQIDVRITKDGLLIQIMDGGDDVFFDLSSAQLKPALRRVLEAIAPVLGKLDNQLQIQGHTDARPFAAGSRRTNWELSFERADNARVVLEEHGVRKKQIIGVFAHADTALRILDDPYADANRRLAILAVRRGAEETVARGVPGTQSLEPLANPVEKSKAVLSRQ